MFVPVCLILIVQATVSRAVSVSETPRRNPDLQAFPMELANWRAQSEQALDEDLVRTLNPTEYLLRDYTNRSSGASVNLFIGYFASLQNNFGPHSPRVCLPGAGWLVRSSKVTDIRVPGARQTIPVNEYVMEKASERIFVLYWYQNDRNVWAEEFWAKLTLLPDLIRYRRSDASLIRLITPMESASPEVEKARTAEFAGALFSPLEASLRSGI